MQDIKLQVTFDVEGTVVRADDESVLKPYHSGHIKNVTDIEFETLLGRPLPDALWNRKSRLRPEDTVGQLRYSRLLGRIVYGLLRLTQGILFALNKPNIANNMEFILNLPFKKIPAFSNGKISNRAIEHFLKFI